MIELLITLGLIGVVLSLAYGLYTLGVTLHSRGIERATVQQEERYLQEYLSRELRFAYGAEIYPVLDEETLVIGEKETILYTSPEGIMQRRGASAARLVVPLNHVHNLTFDAGENPELLLISYEVDRAQGSPPDGVELVIRLFNTDLPAANGTVIKYLPEP